MALAKWFPLPITKRGEERFPFFLGSSGKGVGVRWIRHGWVKRIGGESKSRQECLYHGALGFFCDDVLGGFNEFVARRRWENGCRVTGDREISDSEIFHLMELGIVLAGVERNRKTHLAVYWK